MSTIKDEEELYQNLKNLSIIKDSKIYKHNIYIYKHTKLYMHKIYTSYMLYESGIYSGNLCIIFTVPG